MPRILGRRLTGPQIRDFRAALLDAFDLQRFDEMLRIQLEREREHLSLARDLPTIVYDAISKAEMEDWTAQLLAAALASRPHNGLLIRFSRQFGAVPDATGLESIIRADNPAFDPKPWHSTLGQRLGQVCLIEIQGRDPEQAGTGFLIAPDTVMTCYHVVEDVITAKFPPAAVRLRFDFKATDDGTSLAKDTSYTLSAKHWLIDSSPYGSYEKPYQAGPDPTPQEMDYALLRVDGAPGSDPVGGPDAKDPTTPERGYIPLPKGKYDFPPDSWLPILGHPGGERLQLAIDTQSVIGFNGNNTRVRYRTNATPGSSGSPCFDMHWNLVAMHHFGGPAGPGGYNQGLPLAAIRALWQEKLEREKLGKGQLGPINSSALQQLLKA